MKALLKKLKNNFLSVALRGKKREIEILKSVIKKYHIENEELRVEAWHLKGRIEAAEQMNTALYKKNIEVQKENDVLSMYVDKLSEEVQRLEQAHAEINIEAGISEFEKETFKIMIDGHDN